MPPRRPLRAPSIGDIGAPSVRVRGESTSLVNGCTKRLCARDLDCARQSPACEDAPEHPYDTGRPMTQNPPEPEAWGRIADDGTVYVRTSTGERAIGSWQAGTVDEGLAYYQRRYDDLAAEVAVLEGRVGSPTVEPKAVKATAHKIKEGLATATVI